MWHLVSGKSPVTGVSEQEVCAPPPPTSCYSLLLPASLGAGTAHSPLSFTREHRSAGVGEGAGGGTGAGAEVTKHPCQNTGHVFSPLTHSSFHVPHKYLYNLLFMLLQHITGLQHS